MAIARGLPASIEYVYGAQTSSWASFLKRRHGINATGQKITAATLGENVRVVVIDDAHGLPLPTVLDLTGGFPAIRAFCTHDA